MKNIKWVAPALLACTVLFGTTNVANAASYKKTEVNSNLYSSSNKVLAKVPYQSVVYTYSKGKKMTKVKYAGKTGYIKNSVFSKRYKTTRSRDYLYKSASTKSTIVKYVPTSGKVLYRKHVTGFDYVEYGGKKGYLPNAAFQDEWKTLTNPQPLLSVASTKSKKLKTVSAKSKFRILGATSGYYYGYAGSTKGFLTTKAFVSPKKMKTLRGAYIYSDLTSKAKKTYFNAGAIVNVYYGYSSTYDVVEYKGYRGVIPKSAFLTPEVKKQTAFDSYLYETASTNSKKTEIKAMTTVGHLGSYNSTYDRVTYNGKTGFMPKSAFKELYLMAQKNTAIYTPALGDPVGEIPVGTTLRILREDKTLYTVLYKGKRTFASKEHIDGIKNYVRIKKLLPEKVFDQTMTIIHPKQSYLDWMKTDYDYVKTETDKDKLLEEFKMLSEYLNGELISQIQSVKGMYYTPIYTSAKILVVENAMRNRVAILYPREDNKVLMPEERFLAEMYKSRDDYRQDYTSIDSKQNALNRSRDLEIYNAMDQFPFSEKTFKGMSVQALPFSYYSGEDMNSGSYGYGSVVINTNVAQDLSVRTLYHEMGHFLDAGTRYEMMKFSSDLRGYYDGELAPEDFVETHYPYYNKNHYAYEYENTILPKDSFEEFKRLTAKALSLPPEYEQWGKMNDIDLRYRILYTTDNNLNFHAPGFKTVLDGSVEEFEDTMDLKNLPDGIYSFNIKQSLVYKTITVLVDNVKGFN